MKLPFYKIAASDSGVLALLGDPPRLYPGGAAERGTYPYAAFTTAAEPGNYLAAVPDTQGITVTVDVWDTDLDRLDQVVATLQTAVQQHCYVLTVLELGRDPETRAYRTRMTLDWQVTA